MQSWAVLLAGLLVWAAHFFALYGIGEFAGAGAGSRASVLVLSALALLADFLLARRLRLRPRGDDFARWRAGVALGGVALSALAVVWQALPAFLA